MKRIASAVAVFAALSLPHTVLAQTPTFTGGFGVGYTDVGATLGLGGIGSAGMAFGGRFERGIKALPDMGGGVLGFQVSVDYYRYDESFAGTDYGFTYMPIGATANYHFKVQNKKIDPFLGAGLGYLTASTDYAGSYSSGIYFIGRAGIRYFMNPKMAFYADAGAGAAALNAGITFGLGGAK